MTRVFVAPVGALREAASAAVGSGFSCDVPSEIVEYIENTADSGLREARLTAYSILFGALRGMGINDARVVREESGKPRVSGADVQISLSHTSSLVAVAISDTHVLGVDIEGEISPERAARIELRYLSGVKPPTRELPLESVIFSLGVGRCENNLSVTLGKWTLAEAVIKCYGGDFSMVKDVGVLGKPLDISSMALEYLGKKYLLTLARKPKI